MHDFTHFFLPTCCDADFLNGCQLGKVNTRLDCTDTHNISAAMKSSQISKLPTPRWLPAAFLALLLSGLAAHAATFVQPTVSGTTASGLQWSNVATGTALPIRTSATSAFNGAAGAVAYFDTQTGQLQIDPKGLSLNAVIITYTTGTVNISATTPGPFTYTTGTGTSAWSPTTGTSRTFPAIQALQGLPPTTFAARVGTTIGAPLSPSLATSGDVGNIASDNGFWNKPWSFPLDLVNSGSVSSMVISNFKTIGQNSNSNANILGYGLGFATFQYGINGVTGTQVGPVIPSTTAPASTINATPASLTGFTAPIGNASASQSFTVNGTGLTANITVTAPANFQVSSDNSSFSQNLTLTQTGGNVTAAIVYARIASSASVGSVTGNITLASTGAENQTVALSGTVSSVAAPTITASPASLGNFTAKIGNASTASAFLAGGTNLTANITISAPAGFEISSTGSAPFASSLSVAPANGTVTSTSVYARLTASAAAGANSGNITLASTGATSQQVAVSGTVTLPYEDWVAYWNSPSGTFTGATANGSADPDSDGYSNTTEFAFDADPLSPTASLITVAPAGGNITITFLARVGNSTVWTAGNATGNGANYQIQSSGNLTLGFSSADDVSNIARADDQTGIQPADFPYVRWEFQAPISGEKKFYRVRAVPQGVGDQ